MGTDYLSGLLSSSNRAVFPMIPLEKKALFDLMSGADISSNATLSDTPPTFSFTNEKNPMSWLRYTASKNSFMPLDWAGMVPIDFQKHQQGACVGQLHPDTPFSDPERNIGKKHAISASFAIPDKLSRAWQIPILESGADQQPRIPKLLILAARLRTSRFWRASDW